jgi:iron-sulfur cluster assembly accessory protein
LTEGAVAKLQAMLQDESWVGHGLRLFVHGGGCAGLQYGMAFEPEPRQEDTVLEVRSIRLFVDPFSTRYLEGIRIDFDEALLGGGFRIENPNAVARCACGISFRTEGDEDVEKTCDL